MLVIPAIDLRGGKCVRLTQGDYSQEKVYDADPARVARQFEDQGAQWLHVVDLDGAKSGLPVNTESLLRIRNAVSLRIEVGGGIRSIDTARKLLLCGIDRVIVGTKLVEDEIVAKQLFEQLGDKVAAGVDSRQGKVAVAGWLGDSGIEAVELAQRLESLGARRFVVTDISRDGTLAGPNLEHLGDFLKSVNGAVIASGGVSSLEDLAALAAINRPNLEGVIVGKALYEGRFDLRAAISRTPNVLPVDPP